jgi:hypothetical protein
MRLLTSLIFLLLTAALAVLFILPRTIQTPAHAQGFAGHWLMEFPEDQRAYVCAVYQYPFGYKLRLICRPAK